MKIESTFEPLAERRALEKLRREKTRFQTHIKVVYEPAAKDCRICPTMGICCTDAHFVNVHITRLEAVAMRDRLENTTHLTGEEKQEIYARARQAVDRYQLGTGEDSFSRTYSCPLFQPGAGCLVHDGAKPAPCIHHACYENEADLPPESLQGRVELRVEQLNRAAYGAAWDWLPTPVWLTLIDPASNGAALAEWARDRNANDPNDGIPGNDLLAPLARPVPVEPLIA